MSGIGAPDGLDSEVGGLSGPIRTCVGCRQATIKTGLVRIVRDGASAVPDPTGSSSGRGAYLHRNLECFESASRKRAFARALRAQGALDVEKVRVFLSESPENDESRG